MEDLLCIIIAILLGPLGVLAYGARKAHTPDMSRSSSARASAPTRVATLPVGLAAYPVIGRRLRGASSHK